MVTVLAAPEGLGGGLVNAAAPRIVLQCVVAYEELTGALAQDVDVDVPKCRSAGFRNNKSSGHGRLILDFG